MFQTVVQAKHKEAGNLFAGIENVQLEPFKLVMDMGKRPVGSGSDIENVSNCSVEEEQEPKMLTLECHVIRCVYNSRDCNVILFRRETHGDSIRLLEASNKALHRMTATMTHEMRTPLTAILQASELLLLEETNPKKKQFL